MISATNDEDVSINGQTVQVVVLVVLDSIPTVVVGLPGVESVRRLDDLDELPHQDSRSRILLDDLVSNLPDFREDSVPSGVDLDGSVENRVDVERLHVASFFVVD